MMSLVGQLVGRYWKGNLLVGIEGQSVGEYEETTVGKFEGILLAVVKDMSFHLGVICCLCNVLDVMKGVNQSISRLVYRGIFSAGRKRQPAGQHLTVTLLRGEEYPKRFHFTRRL
jgi:hypothetical protein